MVELKTYTVALCKSDSWNNKLPRLIIVKAENKRDALIKGITNKNVDKYHRDIEEYDSCSFGEITGRHEACGNYANVIEHPKKYAVSYYDKEYLVHKLVIKEDDSEINAVTHVMRDVLCDRYGSEVGLAGEDSMDRLTDYLTECGFSVQVKEIK